MARLRKAGNKVAIKRLSSLLDELREHPTTGLGKPERLKHDLTGCWSREITDKHRLVYQIKEEEITVMIIQAYGHYYDK